MNFLKTFAPVLAVLATVLFNTGADAQNSTWTLASIQSKSGGKALPSLTLGNRAHQATIFAAACFDRSDKLIDVILLRDHDGHKLTGPTVVSFSGGAGTAGYPGEGLKLGGEKDLIRILISADDPLWQMVTGSAGFSYSAAGAGGFSANLPGAGQLGSDFLAACRSETGASTSTAQPATSGVEAGLAVMHTFLCEDGSRLDAFFQNTDAYTVALVTHPSMSGDIMSRNVPLVETVSGSGAAYSNGDYTLQTKGDLAVLSRGNKAISCNAQ